MQGVADHVALWIAPLSIDSGSTPGSAVTIQLQGKDMTRLIGDTLIIEPESPQQCDYCGIVAELRPYGKNGACICHACGMKHKMETEKNFFKLCEKAKTIEFRSLRINETL